MEYIKALIIIAAFLLYWAFVYYRFHYNNYTPISIVAAGAFLFFLGLYGLCNGSVAFSNINLVYFVGIFFLTLAFILVGIGMKKHGLNNKIDITLTAFNKVGGKRLVYFGEIIAYPAFFFIMMGSYYLLGPEHIFAWGMIFLAWIASDIRLIRRIRKKKL